MELSEIFNFVLGGSLLATVIGIVTLKATVRKANAEAEKAKADAETVRIDNAEHATRILVDNIVEPLKEELNATRKDLMATKREMARLRKAIDTANSCRHHDDCPVCAGCATTRRTTQEAARTETVRMTADSLNSEVRLVRTQTVPKSEVRLEIPADSLLKLPPLAQYSGRSGQANVSVSRDKDVITVYASCDSLQVLVEYYERTSSLWRERYEEMAGLYEEEIKQRSNPVKTFFYGFGAGILLSVLTITIIILKRKNNGN